MKKIIIGSILIATAITLSAVFFFSSNPIQKEPSLSQEKTESLSVKGVQTEVKKFKINVEEDIFYWGSTCPHCHTVNEWLAENDPEGKIELSKKEIYEDQKNNADLTVKAKSCGLSERQIGVPFLYTTEGECLIGSPDIIDHLSEKIQ